MFLISTPCMWYFLLLRLNSSIPLFSWVRRTSWLWKRMSVSKPCVSFTRGSRHFHPAPPTHHQEPQHQEYYGHTCKRSCFLLSLNVSGSGAIGACICWPMIKPASSYDYLVCILLSLHQWANGRGLCIWNSNIFRIYNYFKGGKTGT